MEYPDLKRAVWEQATRFNVTTVLIEDKSSGAQLIQELIREGLHGVTRYQPKLDKVLRMNSVTSTIENGFVSLPDQADWLPDYQRELTTFPKGKFDDQCDSTSQALDWVKTGYGADYFVQLFKHMADTANSAHCDKQTEPCPTRFDQRVEPCLSCGSTETSATGAERRCQKCGHRWERPVVFSF